MVFAKKRFKLTKTFPRKCLRWALCFSRSFVLFVFVCSKTKFAFQREWSARAELDLKSFIWKRENNNNDAFNPRFTWAPKEMEFKWTRLILKPEENLFHLNKNIHWLQQAIAEKLIANLIAFGWFDPFPWFLFSRICLLQKFSLKLVTTVLMSTVYFSILGK